MLAEVRQSRDDWKAQAQRVALSPPPRPFRRPRQADQRPSRLVEKRSNYFAEFLEFSACCADGPRAATPLVCGADTACGRDQLVEPCPACPRPAARPALRSR